jgi:hypothetical protein
MDNFKDLFCRRFHVGPDDYVRAVFHRCLYRRTWLFMPLLWLLPNFFASDYQLIRDAGRLKDPDGLSEDIGNFNSDITNTGFLRQRVKFRISARRLQHLVREVFASAVVGEGSKLE